MRIDKYLKVARILKRRTISKELAENDRIEINGRVVKPSHDVKAGDEVSITFGNRQLKIRVLSAEDVKRRKDAADLYEVISEGSISTETRVTASLNEDSKNDRL
ncbi:MAG: RNA-binding S4 domain-containing protein [Erysipelotrichia bacterium]|nr:RNA-binding S4 domain-containing protein [Erysipelotrichia bacterium]